MQISNAGASNASRGTTSDFVVNHLGGESGRKLPQYIAGLAVSAGALATGTFLGWTSQVEIPLVQNKEYGFPISDEEFSWIGSMANLGAALMCLLIGVLMKMIGRKRAMLAMALPLLLGWSLIIFAKNVAMLMVGRFFVGIGGGAFCIAAPTYTAEIAQPSIRGSLGTLYQLLVTIGILFVYGIGDAVNVQMLSIICGAVVPLVIGFICLMPESPQYFIEQNRDYDASRSLMWLRGRRYDEWAEISELRAEEANIREKIKTFFQAFKQRATMRTLIISLGLMFFQQLSGINAVIFYTTYIFNDTNSGVLVASPVTTVIVGAIQVVVMLLTIFIVDKVGRRILLMISAIFMALSTILLAVYFQLQEDDSTQVKNLGWLPVLAVCLFIAMFSIGYGPIPWLMVGELCASNVKAYVSPLAGAFNWLLASLVTKFFIDVLDDLGIAGVFWLFSGLSLLGTVFVFFMVPETKGITLVEVQQILSGERMRRPSDQSNSTIEDND